MSSFADWRRYRGKYLNSDRDACGIMLSIWRSRLLTAVVATLIMPAAMAAKDPTRPPAYHRGAATVATPVQQFRVESIIRGSDRRVAVINGQRLTEGEAVDGARLIRIEADAVVLLWQGQRQRIAINKPSLKKWTKRNKN